MYPIWYNFQATQWRSEKSRPGHKRCGILQTGMGRLLIKIAVVQYLLIWNSQFENQRKQKTSDRDITMLSLRSSALTKKLPASEGEYFWNLSGWSGLYFGGCLIKAEVSCNYVLKLEMRDCIRQVLVSFLLKSTQFFQSFIFILLGELIHFSEFKEFLLKSVSLQNFPPNRPVVSTDFLHQILTNIYPWERPG